jgi:sugar phosphate permease
VIVTAYLSWRWNFWLLAVGGLALSFAFWRLQEPKRQSTSGPARGAGKSRSRLQQIVQERGVEPSRSAMLNEPPTEMNMWDAAKYVVRVRTDLIVLIARSFGDFFFQAIGMFAIVFATQWYRIGQSQADIALLIVGVGAVAGVLVAGWLSDRLLARGHANSRVWLGAVGYIVAPLSLFPALLTHSLYIAVPLFMVTAFFLAGAAPPLDAVRIDVLVARLRGRAEAVRQVLRTLAEGGAPAVIGLLADHLAGGGAAGLRFAFFILLPFLLADGLVTLLALRTYQPDVAAAIRSGDEQGEDETGERQSGAAATSADA